MTFNIAWYEITLYTFQTYLSSDECLDWINSSSSKYKNIFCIIIALSVSLQLLYETELSSSSQHSEVIRIKFMNDHRFFRILSNIVSIYTINDNWRFIHILWMTKVGIRWNIYKRCLIQEITEEYTPHISLAILAIVS